jgi:hypothetical protein
VPILPLRKLFEKSASSSLKTQYLQGYRRAGRLSWVIRFFAAMTLTAKVAPAAPPVQKDTEMR